MANLRDRRLNDPSPRQSASRRGIGVTRRGLLTAVSVALVVTAWQLSARQDLRPDPLDAPVVGSPEWWRYHREVNPFRRLADFDAELTAVFSLGERVWVSGSGGLIARSSDGGRTWEQGQVRRSGPASGGSRYLGTVSSVFFRDSLHGWAVGQGVLLQSADGGKTWGIHRDSPPTHLRSVSFLPSGTGWAVGDSILLVTRDDGRTWDRVNHGFADVRSMGMPTDSLGWLVASDSVLVRVSVTGEQPVATFLPWGKTLDAIATADSSRVCITRYSLGSYRSHVRCGSSLLGSDSLVEVAVVPGKISALQLLGDDGWAVGTQGLIARAKNSGTEWEFRSLSIQDDLVGLHFSDGLIGYAVGRDGVVLSTSDGGLSWHRRAGGNTLLDVQFIGAGKGWLVGEDGLLARTSDGGQEWELQPRLGFGDLRAVQFVDRDIGWVLAEGTVLGTTDGGRTWSNQIPRYFLNGRHDFGPPRWYSTMHFHDREHGWVGYQVLGDTGIFAGVLRTENGGGSWAGSWSKLPRGRLEGDPGPVHGLYFRDVDLGWAVTPRAVWETRDGGRAWARVATGSGFSAIAPAGDSAVWVAGARGTWLRSWGPAGRWQSFQTGVDDEITAIEFANERVGWATGRDGRIWRTETGGLAWDSTRTPGIALQALATSGESLAWAVGGGGTVLRTTDGRTWVEAAAGQPTRPAPWLAGVVLVAGLAIIWLFRVRDVTVVRHDIEDLLISDRPLGLSDPDPLELGTIAKGVSRFVQNDRTSPPLTIAVTGPWGRGKSSLMRMVCDDLERLHYCPVWFNAWHHQKEEHLLASLLEVIRRDAIPSWNKPFQMFFFRLRLLWIRTKQHVPLAGALLSVVAFYGTYLIGNPEQVLRNLELLGAAVGGTGDGFLENLRGVFSALFPATAPHQSPLVPLGIGGGLLVAIYRGVRAFGAKPAALMASVMGLGRVRALTAQAGLRSQFAREFSDVTNALKPKGLVIFLDDLDRCRREQVMAVLEAVNFLVSSGPCFIVMGMDRDRVREVVGLQFKDEAESAGPVPSVGADDRDREVFARDQRLAYADRYLEKLVNLEVRVPEPTKQGLKALVLGGTQRAIPSRRREWFRLKETVRGLRQPMVWGLLVGLAFLGGRSSWEPEAAPVSGATGLRAESPLPQQIPPAATLIEEVVPVLVGEESAPAMERLRPATLVSRSYPEAPSTGYLAAVLIFVILLVWLLSPPMVQDSEQYRKALETWAPWLASKHLSPRTTKKFLNELRFFAMRVRTPHEPGWRQRIIHRLSNIPALGSAFREYFKNRKQAEPVPSIPDAALVALATVRECAPELLGLKNFYAAFDEHLGEQRDLSEGDRNAMSKAVRTEEVHAHLVKFSEIVK